MKCINIAMACVVVANEMEDKADISARVGLLDLSRLDWRHMIAP
jgi:hypothetical protein